jgi:N-acetylglucosamine-6-phosphate deacetylase
MIVDEPHAQYVDLQVNGYAGVDFNQDDLSADALHRACLRLQSDGVRCLATIISDDLDVMCARLRRLAELRSRNPLTQAVVLGIHIEGPFISPVDGFRGAHPRDAIREADVSRMDRLLEAAGGLARIVTLAPECDPQLRVTRFLASRGIVVSAGHTDAPIDRLRAAIDAGLTMCTHVGNGCPMRLDRHDNIIQRMLSLADRLWLTFIADGVHVPFVALRNYLRLAGSERAIVVTDAIAAAGLGPGRYTLGRWTVSIGEDMVARAPDGSHLVGSAATMPKVTANLREHAGLTDAVVRRLTAQNPAQVLAR